ncbi:MAG: acyltransferase, partial [Actinobacteria bacterium]|nr:acyltransferase [Actinomycetota bacterium]
MSSSGDVATSRHRLGYQPALDGLRGLAVFAVLAYHGGISGARGGFLGVDVFFVLSGYLITALLVQEWGQTGRIDIRAFWVRRVKRLMPALIMLAVAMVGWLFLLAEPAERSGLRLDILASLGYVANWRFVVSGQSYFAQFANPSPLRHTWSLAVEEQWYLIWPLVVWAGLRVTRGRLGRLTLLVVGAAMGSAVWAAVLWGNGDLSRIYYGTDTRAQELLMGAGLALLLAKVTFSPRLRWLFDAMGVAALGALVSGAVLVHDTSPWLYRGGLLGTSLVV